MVLHRRSSFVALALTALMVLSACGSQPSTSSSSSSGSSSSSSPSSTPASQAKPAGPKADAKIVYAQHMPIKSLDSVNYQTYPAGYEAGFAIYSNLVTFDKNLKIVPDLAESWTVTPDGLVWTFKLRKGVKFHDGTAFNAAAVKHHITRIQDKATGSPNKNLWDHIIAVETPDENTIVLKTKTPFGAMLNYLAHGSGGIVSPAAVAKHGKEYAANPVGTGPWKVKSFTPGADLVLVRNDDYFGTKAKAAEITFKHVPEAGSRVAMLQTGEADIITDVPPEEAKRLEGEKDVNVIRVPGLRTFFMEFNLNVDAFKDVKVRQAMNYAIDKESIVKNLFLGYASVLDSPAAPTIQGYGSGGAFKYDPEKAKSLLQEAGYKLENGVMVKNGQPLKFTLNTAEGEYPKDIQVVETIQNQLKAVGVQAEIWKVEKAARWSYLRLPIAEAKYQALLFGFNPSNGDVGYHLAALFRSNPDQTKAPYVWNLMWYKNSQVDELLTRGEQTTDQAARAKLYQDAQKLIYQDAPAVWLYTPDLLVATRKNISDVIVWPTVFTIVREAGKS